MLHLTEVLRNVVEHKGNYYYVDSRMLFLGEYQTMIFVCDKKGKVLNWNELYVEDYDSYDEMERCHNKIVANIGNVI